MRRAGVAEAARTARAMYRSLGIGVVELATLWVAPRRELSRVEWPAALPSTAAVVATAHTGNWDVVACAVASRAPLTVITKHLSIGLLDRLWQGVRRRSGVSLVSAGAAAGPALAALRRGGLVAMLIDQRPERIRATARISFLGQLADVDLAPALLALRARVPLVVAFPARREGRHSIEVVRVLGPPDRRTRDWALAAMVEATEALEQFVRRNPEQWLWMHRRWSPDSIAVPAGALPVERGSGIRAT
jgi:KDO2-lipid IV(A) lauroyltransferase